MMSIGILYLPKYKKSADDIMSMMMSTRLIYTTKNKKVLMISLAS